jgi:predicted O-methyltransferase YrrM
LGAGSKIHSGNQRKISDLNNTAQKPTKYAQLLARLVTYFQPSTILDLGTSLGLTTAYMALSGQNAKVYSFEGCPQTAAIAQENLAKLGVNNVSIIKGNIDHTLQEVVSKLSSLILSLSMPTIAKLLPFPILKFVCPKFMKIPL